MLNIVVGIILLVTAIFLTVAILMQEGKSSRLSGAIAGGSDNFFGKNKKGGSSKRLSAITTVVAICFTVVVLVLYILQPNGSKIDMDQMNPADPDAVTTSEKATDADTTEMARTIRQPAAPPHPARPKANKTQNGIHGAVFFLSFPGKTL